MSTALTVPLTNQAPAPVLAQKPQANPLPSPPSSTRPPARIPWGDYLMTGVIGAAAGAGAWMLQEGTPLGSYLAAQHTAAPYVSVLGVSALTALCSLVQEKAEQRATKRQSMCVGDIKWDRNSFCRGWLITGSTGSGKTEFIKMMMHLLCRNDKGQRGENGEYLPGEAAWGGLCIDEKGFFQEEVLPILGTYGRSDDVVVLSTRPDDAPPDWRPKFCFNLLGDDRVSTSQYVDSILRTAETIAKSNSDKGFFKTQAGLHIGAAIDLYRAIRAEQIKKGLPKDRLVAPTLANVYKILTNQPDYNTLLQNVGLLREVPQSGPTVAPDGKVSQGGTAKMEYHFGELDSPHIRKGIDHFRQRFWGVKAQEQLEGVKGTIVNYLHWFTDEQVCEVFCREDATFRIDVMDLGRILCLSMPQRLAIPRRYICALMKLLAYAHGRGRNPVKYRYNMLIIWQDEAQRFIQDADQDVEILRQYQMTTVISTQSKQSLLTAFDQDKVAKTIMLNLRNRVILRGADEDCAKDSSDFIGKALRVKKSRTVSASGTSYTYNLEPAYIYEPYQIRNLPDFVAIVLHAGGKRRVYEFCPMDNDGNTPPWFADKCSSKMRSQLGWINRGHASRFVQTKVPKPMMSD